MADYQQNIYYTFAFDMASGKFGHEFVYSIQEDKIYKYNGGVWEAMYKEEIFKLMQEKRPQLTAVTPAAKQQVLDFFKTLKHARLEVFNKFELLNFVNNMYDPIGNNVVAHKPEYYSTIRLPYIYHETAQCDLWLKTLNEIFENDKTKIDSLQEYFGYCLTKDTVQIMALLLLGESKSGKSTILHVLKNLIGEGNCSPVEMKNISNPQYTPMLINKLVNIDADVSEHAKDFEAEFKKITSGEAINCNQKFVPTFSFVPYCKIVIAANKFPRITDHSSAFYNRLLVIPCDRIFLPTEQDRTLKLRLLEELPGILQWSLRGLRRLNKRGMFENKEFMKVAITELENENNPSNLFFDEHVEIDMNNYIEKGELYKRYKEWSDTTKNYALSENRFSNAVYKKFSSTTSKNARLEGGGKRIWRNLKYVHFKDETKQEIEFDPAVAVDKTISPTTIMADSQQDIDWST